MTKFTFRLESILSIKMKLEEQAKMEFGAAKMKLNEEQEKLDICTSFSFCSIDSFFLWFCLQKYNFFSKKHLSFQIFIYLCTQNLKGEG